MAKRPLSPSSHNKEPRWIGDWDDIPFKSTTNKPFLKGQGYTKKKAQMFECTKCGDSKFEVGQDDYFTAIRCVKCKWEACIHDG